MKKIVISSLFFLLSSLNFYGYSQSWHVEVENDLESDISTKGIETSGGDFIFAGTQGGNVINNSTLRARDLYFIKISSEGDVLGNISIEIPEPYKVSPIVILSDVYPEEDVFLMTCVLNDQDTGERYSGIYKIDADLNILWDTIVGETGDFATISQHFLLNDSTLLFWGANYPDFNYEGPFIMKMGLDGQIQEWINFPGIGENTNTSGQLVDLGSKYIFNSSFDQNNCFINKETFEATSVYDFSFGEYLSGGPDLVFWRHGITPVDDSRLVISTSGSRLVNINPVEYTPNLGFCILDSNNVIDTCYSFIEENSSISFVVDVGNVTYSNGYVYLTYTQPSPSIYFSLQEWFVVVKYDLDGNLVWKSYVDFIDDNFIPLAINGSSDGGVILSGFRYHPDQGEIDGHRNSVVVKIDKNGALVGTKDPLLRVVKIPIYPNPVIDKLFIHSDNKDLSISIFSMNGKQLLSTSVNNNEVDVKGLPSNMYTYSILKNGKIIDSGKFIKE